MDKLKELHYGSIATVTGRYYAMDRDKRHERNKIAYEGLVQGIGEETTPDNLIKVLQGLLFEHYLGQTLQIFSYSDRIYKNKHRLTKAIAKGA